jgi:hypothetical protein
MSHGIGHTAGPHSCHDCNWPTQQYHNIDNPTSRADLQVSIVEHVVARTMHSGCDI